MSQSNPRERKALVLRAFETLIHSFNEGAIPKEMSDQIIADAKIYADRWKMPFDGTFKGAIRLLEEANKTCQDHASRQESAERQALMARREAIIQDDRNRN